MKLAAALLLIITFVAIVSQAAPLHTYAAPSVALELSIANITTSTSVRHGTAASIPPVTIQHTPHLLTSSPNPTHASALVRHNAPTPMIPPSSLLARKIAEKVVLERRWNLGSKIKSAFHHVRHTISHVAHAVKHAGHFIAHHGPAIAKVGLKVAATVGEVAGKAAPFIPGLGAVAGKALVQASKKLNKASDAIHAHVGGRLGAVMHGMNMAQRIAGKIP